MEQIDLASKTGCNIDLDLCFTCTVCNFMTNSTEYLNEHTTTMHQGMAPKFMTKFISESDYTSTKQADSLSTLTHANDTTRMDFLTRERDEIPLQSDSTIKLECIDERIEVDSNDLKPIVKDLSNMLSNVKDSFDKLSSSSVKTEVEHDDKIFSDIDCDINQSGLSIKQEIQSPSISNCEMKDKIIHCQSCSYSDVDIGKLKSHKFTQHPTEAAVITNYFGETDFNSHNTKFFCVKEMCFFSTTLCIAYERHLLRCCSKHQTMTKIERERLKSTITFVLDFHSKLGLETWFSFLDFVSDFNEIYTSNADQDKNKDGFNIGTKCNKCGRIFVQEGKNLVYLATHGEEKGFKCDECAVRFRGDNTSLIQTSEQKEERRFKCNECGKCFIQEGQFTEHMRIHTGEKPFVCNECGIGFIQKIGLTVHMKLHTREKPFKCDECGNGFCNKFNLAKHMKIHTGEKPFKCDDCGKDFSHKSNLKLHMRVHTGERPYMCDQCGKGFCQKSSLTVHMRAHTGVKPFSCNECGKGFIVKNSLTVHMRVHTREKAFMCNECGKCFSGKHCLKYHMRLHTGEKPF